MVLGHTPIEQIQDVVYWDIIQTAYSRDYIIALDREGRKQKKPVKIHIKVDTGMGRIGFLEEEEVVEVIKEIQSLSHIILDGIFTHFSVADQEIKAILRCSWKLFITS